MKRTVIVLCVLGIVLAMLPGTLGATPAYFSAIDNEVLPLETAYTPYITGGVLYVPTTLLTYSDKVISVVYSKDEQTLTLLRGQKWLVFDLNAKTAYDGKKQYEAYAVQSRSSYYVPAAFVFNHFGLVYTAEIETPYGKMFRLKTKDVSSDNAFVSAMEATLKKYYEDYTGTTQSPAGGTTLTPSPTPERVREAYLTFDDGPNAVTPDILDTLDKYGVKATFFVLGSSIAKTKDSGDILRRMVGSGHAIGNHGYSHDKSLFYASPESVISELNQTNSLLYEACMLRTRIVRAPYGSKNGSKPNLTEAMQDAMGQEGYRFWDWNIDPGDSLGNPTAQQISSKTIAALEKITDRPAIILLHDRAESVKSLPAILDYLKNEQYTMRTIAVCDKPSNYFGNYQ